MEKQNAQAPDLQKSVSDAVIEKEDLAHCREAINSLSEGDKRIVFLKYAEGLSSKEIGLLEGASPNTIRWRIALIKAHIAKQMEGKYEG